MIRPARDIAFDAVKRMKKAWLLEGCEWQLEIERVIEEVRAEVVAVRPYTQADAEAAVAAAGLVVGKSIYPLVCGSCGTKMNGPSEHNDHRCPKKG